MFRQYLTFAVISCCALAALANTDITFTVVESGNNNEPCSGATVKIYNASDTSKAVIMSSADMSGVFKHSFANPGDYVIVAEYIGKKTNSINISVPSNGNSQIYTIMLDDDAELLQEIVVTGRKPLIQSDGATLTYNTEEDATAKSSSVLEMLRKVPLVTVDAQDNVKVSGQSDFKIYINGKPSPLLASNASQVLKAMPAASISKVEVITEPGAKYDAEGVGGILNLVTIGTQQQADDGYYGNVNASFSHMGSGLTFYGKAKYNKVTAALNLTYHTNKLWNSKSTQESENIYLDNTADDAIHQTIEKLKLSPDFSYIAGNLNLSWEPNAHNLFTADVNISTVPVNINTEVNGNGFNYKKDLLFTYLRSLNMDMDRNNLSVNTSYQHSFRNPEHTLTLSYQFDHGLELEKTNQLYTETYNYYPELPYLYQHNSNSSNSHTFQVDYTLPINNFSKFETGGKLLIRRNFGNSWDKRGENPDNAGDKLNIVDMLQFNDIYALYATYHIAWKKWGAVAGVRYEHTRMGSDFKVGNYDDFTTHLNDIVPNAALTFSFGPVHNIRAAYQMRISRPSLSQVNPFRVEHIASQITFGNPDLESEKIHNFNIVYTNFENKVGFTLKANYFLTNNMISDYTFAENNTVYETYANLGRHQKASLNAYAMTNLFGKLQLGLGANVDYDHYKVKEINLLRHGWSANFNGSLSYLLPLDFSLSAFGGGSTKEVQLQGTFSGWKYYGLSLKKSFLKGKNLEMTLSGMNFFSPNMTWRNETITDNLVSRGTHRSSQWNVGISISYSFGSLKGNVKKTNAQIDNSDASTVSGNGGVSTSGNGGNGMGQ